MAEFCFATAWAAGVVEGGSILRHAKKQENEETSPTMLVPSLLYGTAALPLGVIGASPGPSLVASFPFAPPISALESVVPPQPGPIKYVTKKSKRSRKKDEPETTSTNTSEEQEHPISSRSEMIRKVREDNRRSLAARQQLRPQHVAPPPKADVLRTRPSSTTTKLLATLDGRPLATPLAEAMRRARFLFVGAGLVMTMVSYEKSRNEEQKQQAALQRERRRQGRDVNAIQSLVKEGDSQNGVFVRLVDQNESLQGLTESRGVVVPVVYSVDSKEHTNLTTSSDTAYWNLGTTLQEWKQTPFTKDWLLRTSENDDQASLVLEADVSLSSLSDYLSPGDRPSLFQLRHNQLQSIKNAIWVSRILGMVAQQKGVLDDNETTCTPVNVLIGFGTRPAQLADTNTIYINGPAAVASEVLSILERVHADPMPSAEGGETAAVNEEPLAILDESAPAQSSTVSKVRKSVDDTFSLLEYVGMKLREGGTQAATAVTSVFSKGDKMVYVLSDSSFAVQWLRQTMPYGWNVRGYDALNDSDAYHNAIAAKEGITFVCCGNDEATCAMICSLLMDEQADTSHIMVLVQEESCAYTIRDLTAELNKETNVDIVSITGVHSKLFDQVRELLASGKTPSEVQESINYLHSSIQ